MVPVQVIFTVLGDPVQGLRVENLPQVLVVPGAIGDGVARSDELVNAPIGSVHHAFVVLKDDDPGAVPAGSSQEAQRSAKECWGLQQGPLKGSLPWPHLSRLPGHGGACVYGTCVALQWKVAIRISRKR